MAGALNPRFMATAEEIHHVGNGACDQLPREQKERCLAQKAETLRFRLDLKPFVTLVRGDMFVRQAISRGDGMYFVFVIPSVRLYRFQVCTLLGEVGEVISKRFGIYVRRSDLKMEQSDGNSLNRSYSLLDVAFSALSSTRWAHNFTSG